MYIRKMTEFDSKLAFKLKKNEKRNFNDVFNHFISMQTYRSSHDENSPFRQLKHSECQLDVHGMFTEIRISGIVE